MGDTGGASDQQRGPEGKGRAALGWGGDERVQGVVGMVGAEKGRHGGEGGSGRPVHRRLLSRLPESLATVRYHCKDIKPVPQVGWPRGVAQAWMARGCGRGLRRSQKARAAGKELQASDGRVPWDLQGTREQGERLWV